MGVMRIIESEACIAEGVAWLVEKEASFGKVLALTGPPPLRRREHGFAALLGAIVSQQLSVAAADSVWKRLESEGLTDEAAIRAADETALRGCGLSGQKVRYAKALSESRTDFAAFGNWPDEDIVAELTRIPGIGRWTAEIYVMFALGRADVFAAGDLALRESARLLFDLPSRPPERELASMALAWSPWRTVAAGLLWSYYRHAKNREGIRS
ncbi:MAG: DNA-3-methyladenine glycosylase 2 family protein [Paracoccaceae bacterium]|nr:DNA-3-methyladenine glycosylase 2 family protein [Paracoccaceae bacterium]